MARILRTRRMYWSDTTLAGEFPGMPRSRQVRGEGLLRQPQRLERRDHCLHPDLVPGILFSNLRLSDEPANIIDLAPDDVGVVRRE